MGLERHSLVPVEVRCSKNNMNEEAGLMYVVCSYCGDFLESKSGPINAISHGCCEDCFKEQIDELDQIENNTLKLVPSTD